MVGRRAERIEGSRQNKKQKRGVELKNEIEAVKAKIERVEDAYEDGKYTLDRFEARVKKHEDKLKEIEAELARMSLAGEDLQEQVELILELMETMQYQWFDLDYAKKVSILDVLAEKVTLEEDGTGKPFIEWDLPWKAIRQISSSSNMQIWYTLCDGIRTFLGASRGKARLKQLKSILDGCST